MKTLLTTVITLGMLMGACVAQSAPKSTSKAAGNSAADEAAIRKLFADERVAMLHGDTQALEQQFSDDFVVTNPFNKFLTKRDVINGVASGMIAMQSFERTIEYLKIYGDIAVVAGAESGVWGGKMPVAGKPIHIRFTGVVRKVNGHWVEIARHASIVMPPPPAPTK